MSKLIEQPRFSCALAAQTTVLAIPRALPIVHAGPGCAAKTFHTLSDCSGNQGEGYGGGGQISSTNTGTKEVVFGGENKLRTLTENAFKVLDADLFVLLSGCTSGIIGDDIVSIANEFREEGKPVVGAETSGFTGNNYHGHEIIVNSIIEQFVGDVTPKVQKGLVNVFSVVPNQDPFWRGDLEEIKRILTSIGLKVNILFGYESAGVFEWKNIPNAEFNILLSPWVGLKTVELLKKKYGTPFFHFPYLPVGGKATSLFLKKLAAFANLNIEKILSTIKREEEKFYSYIVGLADFLSDFRSNIPNDLYLVANSEYAIGVSDFLVNELGLQPKGIFITDEPPTEAIREKILLTIETLGKNIKDAVHFESDGGKIQQELSKLIGTSKRAVIFGSTWEKIVAEKNNNMLIHLSLPIVDDVILGKSFTGYTGGLKLTEELYSGIFKNRTIDRCVQVI
ncbi:MAG: hydrogenase [Treponema sp.]|jgi:nitrogenase molybdenum-iron protein beta chain|nr:hydrogenase [Treponema sp.]